MTWSAFICTIPGRTCCPRPACSPLRMPRPESCWSWIPVAHWCVRNLLGPMQNDSRNWTAPCAALVSIRSVSARQNHLPKHCSVSLKPDGEGEGDDGEVRRPKSEGRRKAETRDPKSEFRAMFGLAIHWSGGAVDSIVDRESRFNTRGYQSYLG